MRRLYYFVLLLVTNIAFGQSVYNSGLISIQPNTVLSIGDSLTNNGEIMNNGELQVAGTWINNGTYDAGNGQLTLTSPTPQVVNHNAQSFSQLSITGGGEKIFQADIIINDGLTLTSGILKSENGARIVLEDGALITGGSDDSYIEGEIVVKGTGQHIVPLGLNGIYLPFELRDVRGVNPELTVSLSEPGSATSVNPSLESVSPLRYWSVNLTSGTFDGSLVKLPIRDESFLDDINDAVVAYAMDPLQLFQAIGQVQLAGDIISGSVTSNTFASTGVFAIGRIPPEDLIEVFVYNAISPNGDGLHDFLKIVNIEYFPDNKVTIYNRWGDKVFETDGYNNVDNYFMGDKNIGSGELNDGTYYYSIENLRGKVKNGFFVLRR